MHARAAKFKSGDGGPAQIALHRKLPPVSPSLPNFAKFVKLFLQNGDRLVSQIADRQTLETATAALTMKALICLPTVSLARGCARECLEIQKWRGRTRPNCTASGVTPASQFREIPVAKLHYFSQSFAAAGIKFGGGGDHCGGGEKSQFLAFCSFGRISGFAIRNPRVPQVPQVGA